VWVPGPYCLSCALVSDRGRVGAYALVNQFGRNDQDTALEKRKKDEHFCSKVENLHTSFQE
jgi:hypothetical protein